MGTSRRKSQNATIYDIAEELGISVSTVSRVLNGFEHVRASTRQRVLEAAERMGYVANVQARSLAGGRSNMIGVVVPGVDNSYINAILSGIDDELARANLNLILYTTHRENRREAEYVRAVANGMTDGLILVVPLARTSYLDALREQHFPYVIVDQNDPTNESWTIQSTNWEGAYDATRYLIELGHRRIGFITGLKALSSSLERLEGYKAALRDHGIPIMDSYIIEGDFWEPQGYEAGRKFLGMSQRPTAIFASNDLMAFGVLRAVWERGLSVPQDMSIVGFDDVPQAAYVHPALTTVQQPLEQMGRIAARKVIDLIAHPGLPCERITLTTQLVIRQSCQSPSSTV